MIIAQSNDELEKVKAGSQKISKVAMIEATQFAQLRKNELEKDVAIKRKEEQIENKRAEILTTATEREN